ncbi:large subunit of carbamoyl-phosphate synthase [Penicillium bovifimosum]|uniref:carbamoyl-phosphate synthase (ammonia) n=1 Tax=Penicillium bovifimosum TaxID=126998 RepID=A0A9W9GSU3_9EURO|nr:large subunit of carbamoyl-phosphate synthase [Penicillium bovifimosum]KAJ5129465.1 large subunit of carbamoyl-phosphate synthase [Penicillium bovifimosum]
MSLSLSVASCLGILPSVPRRLAVLLFLGTKPLVIGKAEDCHKFSSILDNIGVDQPAWRELTSVSEAEKFAEAARYPLLVRPGYVLSGAAMNVTYSVDELKEKLLNASAVSPDHPVVISKLIEGAEEIHVDAVASNGKLPHDLDWSSRHDFPIQDRS